MTIDNAVSTTAGFLIILSLSLGSDASPLYQTKSWLWLNTLVGLSLFQSAFTGFCPSATIFKKLGLK